MISNIREILIISTPDDLPRYKKLLGDGSEIGMKFKYIVQPSPNGLAEAFILGKEFIEDDDVCLILGDNIFYGHDISSLLSKAVLSAKNNKMATVFGYHVNDPDQYGVVEFDSSGKAMSIEEKPKNPKSNFAITGLYFYPNDVVNKAIEVLPSDRGELEITSINQTYLKEKRLKVELMGRGYAWLDTGTHKSLHEASSFIELIERRQGLKVACIEEIAYKNGYINREQLIKLAKPLANNQYGEYLMRCAEEIL